MDEIETEQQLQEVDQMLPQEPTAIAAEAPVGRLPHSLRAFRHRNYRLFFFGQIVSLTGTWLQQVALSWLVYDITNSRFLLGLVGFVGSFPIMILSLPAGVIADRFSKRNIIILTQSSAMILAFALAILTHTGHVTVYQVMAINFLLGAVNALDAPTRHSFVIEMVGREDLPCAIALNSATFNGARILGPAAAGVIIAKIGSAGAFFLNGVSFIAVIIGLLLMRVRPVVHPAQASMIQGLKEAFAFVRRQSVVLSLLILTAIVSVFSMSYAVLMPVFAKDILGIGAQGLGFLMACTGIGALIGAVVVSSLGYMHKKGSLLLIGNLTFCAMLILFSFSRILSVSLVLLVIAGWGMMTNMSLTNTLIQTSTPDHLRGRVMSLYTLMFLGMAPIGSLQAGSIAQWLGAPWAVRIGATVCALAAIVLGPRIAEA